MKKLIFALCAFLSLCTTGCKYDDSGLWDSVNSLEKRVTALEEVCKQLNSNVAGLQTMVNVLNNNDVITSVSPLQVGEEIIGYTISFSKSPTITIYHGKNGNNGENGSNGSDGAVPQIGIQKDEDGHYYWTLNGDWMTDSNGQKISAEGISGQDGQDGLNGQDGVTPQFKIEDGNWYVSTDNGSTWKFVGRAVGEGENNGDSSFSSIDISNADYVIFTLSNGTVITLPRQSELSISFDENGLLAMKPNSTRTIGYTVTGNTVGLHLEVLSSGNVKAKVSNNNAASGSLTITTGATIDEYDKVILLASNGRVTVMSSISFGEIDILKVTSGTTYEMPAEGGTLDINIETNTAYSLSIPEEAKGWIGVMTTRTMRQETITLNIASNVSSSRSAILPLLNNDGDTLASIVISQRGQDISETIPSDMTIAFPDVYFRTMVLDDFDKNRDGIISQDEALEVKEISYLYRETGSVAGIQYFRNLEIFEAVGVGIKALDLRKNTHIKKIFIRGCWNLSSIDINENIEDLALYEMPLRQLDLSKFQQLTELTINECEITELDVSNNKELKGLGVELTPISQIKFASSSKLEILKLYHCDLSKLDVSIFPSLISLDCAGNKLTELDLSKNPNLRYISCGTNNLTELDLSHNPKLEILYCSDNNLTKLDLSNKWELCNLSCDGNRLTELDLTSTLMGSKDADYWSLTCEMETLKKLYLKEGCKITRDYLEKIYRGIHNNTEIVYVD